MSRRCELFGTTPQVGNRVSHSNRKTKTRNLPNLHKKRYIVPELGVKHTITLSTRAIKAIEYVGGISAAILKTSEEKLSERLKKLKKQILDKRLSA